MRPRKFALPQAGTDGYGIRPYIFCGGRSPRAEAAPRVEFSLFVENEIRRGAFYMRPYGGLSYRKRARADMESAPTFFVAGGAPRRGGAPRGVFSLWSKTKSVGAHSICARGGLSCRKRARADMESAPYVFLWRAESPRRGRCPAWSCLPLLKARSVGAHSICARGGLSYRKRARADMESAPTFLKRQRTSTEAVPRVELSLFVESEIRRGAFYMRPRRFILPQAGTGGYGIRPYVFCGGRSPLAEAVPRVELSPFVESEIRRGAFYMRPRRFILPQAGTGGYGIRPYVFL